MLTVVGTSFATLSTASAVGVVLRPVLSRILKPPKIFNVLYSNGTCPSTTGVDGTVTRLPCPDAYGYVLGMSLVIAAEYAFDDLKGTSLICAFLEIFMSLVPPKVLQRIFPPMVTGTVILMIGASLVGDSGIPNWGGGSNDCRNRPETGFFRLCPNITAPKPKLYVCVQTNPVSLLHPRRWGSPEFIGLGFVSFVSIILTEVFGSPFLKNISIIVGLVVGCIVAGATGYIDDTSIRTAPAITFLW